MSTSTRISILDEDSVRRTLVRMARETVARHEGTEGLVVMGIQRRGVQLARMIRDEIEKAAGVQPPFGVPFGTLDITLYRDDLMAIGPRPVVGESELPEGGIDDRAVLLIDDVLYTGRTIRAALNELNDWGRPSRIYLGVLIDRGGRELPIQPDVVGRSVETVADQHVEVLVPDLDGRLGVDMVSVPPEAV